MRQHRRGGFSSFGALLLLLTIVILPGCGSRAIVDIDGDGGGSAEVMVDLDPVFVAYFRDLAGSVGADAEAPIFDLTAIDRRFAEEEAITLTGASVPAQGRLELSLGFEDLEELAADERAGRLLSYERQESGSTVTMSLGREEIPFILSLVGIGEDSPVAYLLPPPGAGMSSEEYGEYLTWALEEYASPGRLEQILEGATVTVTVRAPEPLTSVVNGDEISSREARFTLPLLPVLTGEAEEVYQVSY
ncbi:MAG: hypothetical protein ACOC28_08055 [Alkalispirochaetaceae bacterium]